MIVAKGGNNDKSRHRGFSSHEIIDNYYSLYVNCCEEIDGHNFLPNKTKPSK